MDQDVTWYGARPRPMRLCVRWGPSVSPPKRGGAPLPNFRSFLLWPSGWMHQDATWYRCRPQPRGLCVRWRHNPLPKKGAEPPKFSAHVYCGQTAKWIKMALGMEICLGPVRIVVDGDTAPLPKKGAQPPIFGQSLLLPNGWMHQCVTLYGGRPQPRRLC